MNFMQRLMYGRYGSDQLNIFLLAGYAVLYLLSALFHLTPLSWVGLVFIAFAFYRMMSRNADRRRAENAKFLTVAGPAIQWFKLRRTIRRDRDHRYLKCPSCAQRLRVPKGKGRINVTCRACGACFDAKS